MGVAIIAGHNLLDTVDPGALGGWGPIWRLLHLPGPVQLGGLSLVVLYPVLPWIGVIAAGYALGRGPHRAGRDAPADAGAAGRRTHPDLPRAPGLERLRRPGGWTIHSSIRRSLLSFFDTTKYPPSLLFLLMTLGPALLLLAAADAWRGVAGDVLALIGRVPLFYYLLHLGLDPCAGADHRHAGGIRASGRS